MFKNFNITITYRNENKTEYDTVSTKPVLHGFKVVSWILYAGI